LQRYQPHSARTALELKVHVACSKCGWVVSEVLRLLPAVCWTKSVQNRL
jgi:hypothetical protein